MHYIGGFALFSAIFNSHYTGDCPNWNSTKRRPPVIEAGAGAMKGLNSKVASVWKEEIFSVFFKRIIWCL